MILFGLRCVNMSSTFSRVEQKFDKVCYALHFATKKWWEFEWIWNKRIFLSLLFLRNYLKFRTFFDFSLEIDHRYDLKLNYMIPMVVIQRSGPGKPFFFTKWLAWEEYILLLLSHVPGNIIYVLRKYNDLNTSGPKAHTHTPCQKSVQFVEVFLTNKKICFHLYFPENLI